MNVLYKERKKMKKLFMFVMISGLVSTGVFAGCEEMGGTLISTSNGTFCKSSIQLNWWSAYSWCKAGNMSMVTIYDACPTWDGRSSTCSNLTGKGTDQVWTSTACTSATTAYSVNLNGSNVRCGYRNNDLNYAYAFCK